MNTVEVFLLDLGFSWMWSKIIPYLISLLLGIILLMLLKRKLNVFSSFLKIFFQLVAFSSVFILYFTFYPIYEGDFTNSPITIERTALNEELNGKKIVVLSIPGCPFCYESIGRMKKLQERNDKIKVEYLVCSSDTSTLDWYKEGGGNSIDVNLAKNSKEMIKIAKGTFPTFVLVNGDNALKVWSNNDFGVLALDEVEKVYSN